jgi:hypothetical protein
MCNLIYRRPQHVFWADQQLRPRRHVLILPVGSTGTALPEVPVVEEVSDCAADGRFVIGGCWWGL